MRARLTGDSAVRISERIVDFGVVTCRDSLCIAPGGNGKYLLFEFVGFTLPARIAGIASAYRVVKVVQEPGMDEDARVRGEDDR